MMVAVMRRAMMTLPVIQVKLEIASTLMMDLTVMVTMLFTLGICTSHQVSFQLLLELP